MALHKYHKQGRASGSKTSAKKSSSSAKRGKGGKR